jgi:hypothetical protein
MIYVRLTKYEGKDWTGLLVTSLQHYLGHEDLDTTMLYAEVADPLLQNDYYQGISPFDPAISRLAQPGTPQAFRKKMEQLVNALKTSYLTPERKQEILEQMQLLLDQGL